MNILVVDDDSDILSTIADHLELQGASVDCAANGRQAVNLFTDNQYDVIVLDVMMHGGDGLSACRRLRELGCTSPILFLTARDTLEDKLCGFDAGADDYLVKPFYMSELTCRIQALARRISKQQIRRLCCGDLNMDLDQKLVTRGDVPLQLSQVQYKLLRFFMLQAPKIVDRAQLERELWGDEAPDSDALRSHLYQLRQIIDKPFNTQTLQTVRGMGYRLNSACGAGNAP